MGALQPGLTLMCSVPAQVATPYLQRTQAKLPCPSHADACAVEFFFPGQRHPGFPGQRHPGLSDARLQAQEPVPKLPRHFNRTLRVHHIHRYFQLGKNHLLSHIQPRCIGE